MKKIWMQIRGLRSGITTITYYVTLIALSIFASSDFSFAQPKLSVSNTIMEFGVTTVGNFETGRLTITNTGDSALWVTISISGDTVFFILSGGPYSIPPGMSAVLEMFFNPTSEGAYAATIIINSNDPFTPCFTVNLTGIGNLSHFTGWIKGTVTDAENGDPIGGAQIITDIGISTVSFPNGTYLTVHPAGTYTVTASANGYNENSYSELLIGDAAIVTKDFELITTGAASPGDINIDLEVNLTDAILALQLLARMDISGSIRSDYSTSGADVNGDGKLGMEEAIYVLQRLSEVRINLTGTWNVYYTEAGGKEQGPYEWGIRQTENSVIVCGDDRSMTGSIVGRDILINMGSIQLVGTIENHSSMQGTYTDGTWRMVKISEFTACSEAFFWDIDLNGIPKFVTSDHIELSKITKISKFRSGVGHDFSDDFESCRSMKHYYLPYDGLDWSQIKIFSPINGTIAKISLEGLPSSGKQVYIRSSDYPAFTFRIFHVNVSEGMLVGGSVSAGEEIGTHISDITVDDVAVSVNTPGGLRLTSFFNVMTDSLFQTYQGRGIQSRDDFIISEEARDSDPLNCTGETFGTSGTIENWVNLQ